MSRRADPVAAHLAKLPQPQRDTLTALRATLRGLLPDASESLSSNMPCFKVDGVAVAGFAGFEDHCSYFPHRGNVVGRINGIPGVVHRGIERHPAISHRPTAAEGTRAEAGPRAPPRDRRRARLAPRRLSSADRLQRVVIRPASAASIAASPKRLRTSSSRYGAFVSSLPPSIPML